MIELDQVDTWPVQILEILENRASYIKDEKEREKVASRLTATGKIIVDISLDQVNHFAGNMLELKSRNGKPLMIMSAAARDSLTPHQETIISTYNKILSPELNTIETNGGGSARCMIAEIFYW